MKIVDPDDPAFVARLQKRFPNLGWRVNRILNQRWKRWGKAWAESHGVFFRWY
jgi:hypothetical protein